jgi:hypothetical protein
VVVLPNTGMVADEDVVVMMVAGEGAVLLLTIDFDTLVAFAVMFDEHIPSKDVRLQ